MTKEATRQELTEQLAALQQRLAELERRDGSDPGSDERGREPPALAAGADSPVTAGAEALVRWLRGVFENSPAPLIGLDPDGRVVLWSAGAEELFGWRRDDVLGEPNPTVPADLQSEFRGLFARNFEGQSPTVVHLVRQRRNGTRLTVNLSTSPVRDLQGELVMVLGVFVDVTEQRRAERDQERAEQERGRLAEQLFQAQKMEAIGRLAGGIAHDFNNQLTCIMGTAELLLDQLVGEDDRRQDVLEILKAASHSASLTRDLLTFSRRQVDQPRSLDPNRLLERSKKMLDRLLGEQIEVRFEPGTGLRRVKADPAQFDQVLVNLAVNARDAMPDGGRLSFATHLLELAEEDCRGRPDAVPGTYVVLTAQDDGVGMSDGTLRQIFEPFFTTKEVGTGTGLGLSTVYGIVRQHGGFIEVSSAPGRGTRFDIHLPALEASIVTSSLPPAPVSRRGTGTVLLVEDDEVVRRIVRKALEHNGYRVLAAEDGTGASDLLDQAADGGVDLLVTDVVMPKMDGLQLHALLRRKQPQLRALFISGYSQSVVGAGGALPPGTAFLAKPFSVAELTSKVHALIRRKPNSEPDGDK